MLMPMVRIGHMRVVVHEALVVMQVAVRLPRRVVRTVRVLVMLVVRVLVLVGHRRVLVAMRVFLAKQERDAQAHGEHRDAIQQAERITEQEHGCEAPTKGAVAK